MIAKFRVHQHGYVNDGQTNVRLTGHDGTSGDFNLTLKDTEAAKYPVGTVVSVTLKVEGKAKPEAK